jgi:HD-GYP domain-containing protein (c-di-GMP phosphodiesterase class II)
MGVLYIGSDSPIRLDQKQDMVGRLTLCAANAIIRHRLCETEEAHTTAVIKALINAVDAQQPFFAGHSERVAAAAVLIAGRLNLAPGEALALKYSALLHDAGKIRAGEGEQAGMEHPQQGAALLPEDEFFLPIKEAILSHHERYDGKGYPQGLIRNDIPFLARIITVADVYDALVRLCPEEERLTHARAVQTIKKATGTLFDPLVVVAFEEVAAEINAFYQNN